ncbi:alpha/beta hydrolase [Clostridium felsineum]|uniref:alpha/beta fold hydrolase n=1 Tax=Clostridium felsineum TaxID=36839 RepID=UPI00214D657A|nr:alpha/beta hydrolase [Clostridium felsineum]MCR3760686.1 alpha/beta hydrolase [Clostridium felsineum]
MEKIKIFRNTLKLRNIDMFYLDTRTEKTAIICLHGMYGRAETWQAFIQNYGTKYRIIAPDQRGHGLTSKPKEPYTIKIMAEDIVELLKALKLQAAILVGHSMGGGIAAYLAANYPEYIKALTILDKSPTNLNATNKLSIDRSTLIDPLTGNWPLPFATLTEATSFIKSASCSDLEYTYFMNSLMETSSGYKMMFDSKAMASIFLNSLDFWDTLSRIKCLTMIVRSSSHEGIPNEDFKRMAACLKNHLAFEMSNKDHNVHLSNKEEFYTCFDKFLSSI